MGRGWVEVETRNGAGIASRLDTPGSYNLTSLYPRLNLSHQISSALPRRWRLLNLHRDT